VGNSKITIYLAPYIFFLPGPAMVQVKKRKKLQAASYKLQAPSFKRHEKDTIE